MEISENGLQRWLSGGGHNNARTRTCAGPHCSLRSGIYYETCWIQAMEQCKIDTQSLKHIRTYTDTHIQTHTHTQTHMNTDCWEILFSCVSTAPVVWRWLYPLLESCGVCVDRSETSADVRSPRHKKEANINNNINEILIKGEPLVYTRAWHTVQKNKKHHLG